MPILLITAAISRLLSKNTLMSSYTSICPYSFLSRRTMVQIAAVIAEFHVSGTSPCSQGCLTEYHRVRGLWSTSRKPNFLHNVCTLLYRLINHCSRSMTKTADLTSFDPKSATSAMDYLLTITYSFTTCHA